MSNTPIQDPGAQGLSSGSGQTLPSRPLQSFSDPSASKRVCFYKSGDYKFSGHRMVINGRTFKTFDALLDALSKKVPLPFGVRTITTPRGTHLVKGLDDLHDGGSYVCSDQRRVKPLNLDEVNRRQVPWNTTRPLSTGRKRRQGLYFGQSGKRNEVNRPAKVTERVAVRTPKRLVVIKNRDPTVKRTIVLQRRTAPTFDALLDYLSQVLQFPVLKLYSTDGRRVDGLATLILCSGVVVAAGNEPFRLGNYSFHRSGQMAQVMYVEAVEPSILQPIAHNSKSFSSGRGSRNFSLSSERYIVNQINKSRNGSLSSHLHHDDGSFETEVNRHHTSVETRGTGRAENEHHPCTVPQDDDIEKSFRVNQDGSMTVEMRVRLTIKEEEMLHWTTTLSRSSLSKRTVCASISESGNSSPDLNNAVAKESTSEDETKEENHPTGAGKGVGFNDEQLYEGYTSTALGKAKASFKRTPTPGPRHVKKKTSVESVKMVTESGVQESTLGHYSYMERTADGETTEGYCVVRHSSSSQRPIPKPRKTASAGASNKGSTVRSTGVAEVLQIENNGMQVTETVMHIYESQGCYDNYFANEDYSTDSVPLHDSTLAPDSKPSTESGPRSSSNDCDIDFSWQPPTADSQQRQREEMLSLSSEPAHEITNLSSVTENDAQMVTNSQAVKKDKTPKSEKNKKIIKPTRNHKSSTSTSSSDKKLQESIKSPSKNSKHSPTDKLSSKASTGKKSLSSSESAKSDRKSKGAEKPQSKKQIKDEKTPRKDSALLVSNDNVKRTPPKRQSMNKMAAKYNGHNVNTPTGRPQMKKNISDILQPKESLLPARKTASKPKSMTENRISSPKKSLELSESVSMPSLNPTPSEIHQYVENWLEKVSQDQVPYTEADPDESEPPSKVVFQIGGDSESDEKSECHTNLDECYPLSGNAIQKSASCLSVPLYHGGPETSLLCNEQRTGGLCVSMPSVRVVPVPQENKLRAHKSASAIGPTESESTSPPSNILSPKAKIKPVLRQLCSSIQCIRRASDANSTSNLEKSNSLPDFSTQVASVFGSSCKAFLSFLSVMTLRESLTGSAPGDTNQSRSGSEAMLMMESLQKISAIDDEEEQRASLTDLQSRASSQFKERWKDFQILRERLESEPLSPRVSETEFALDVVSEGGDVFEDQQLGIEELMDELNMPQDLRAEISSTIQQARSFYPVEESTFAETERNQSDSEEDVEKFVDRYNDETKQSTDPDNTCIIEDIAEKNQDNDDGAIDDLNEMQSVSSEEAKTMRESEQEPDKAQESVRENETEEKEVEDQLKEVEEEREEVGDREDGETKEINNDDEELENTEKEREEETDEVAMKEGDEGQDDWEAEKGSAGESVEKVEEWTEEEITGDEEGEKSEEGEKEAVEEGLMDEEEHEAREDGSVEETDEREGVEETEVEEEGKDEFEEEADKEGTGEGGGNEEERAVEIEEEADEAVEETDEDVAEVQEEEEKEEAVTENDVEEEAEEVVEETEEVENIAEEINKEAEEEEEMDVVIQETDEGEDINGVVSEENSEEEEKEGSDDGVENTEEITAEEVEEEEEVDVATEKDEGEEEEVIEETDEGEEAENITKEVDEEEEEEERGEEMGVAIEKEVEESEEVEETDEEDEAENIHKEVEEGEEEMDVVVDERDGEEDKMEGVSEENIEEEEGGSDAEVESTEERRARVISDEDEEEEETDKDTEEEEKCDEGSRKEPEEIENSLEEESTEEKAVAEELEFEENAKTGQTLDEEEREDDEEDELSEELEQVEQQESKDEAEEGNVSEDADSFADDRDCKNLLEEASYLQQHSSGCEESGEHNAESPTKCSPEGQHEHDKGNGTDTVNELETDEGGEHHEERSITLSHPVEISQELLDFVNSALQSSSLIFTYDARGNVKIEPDNARVVQTKQTVIPKSREDSSYGLKRLPSPSTSDLSDYRPETSESGGYKTQESVEIVTESGEEASERPFPVYRHKTDSGRTSVERAKSKLSAESNSEVLQSSRLKSLESLSSFDSGTKASREDLSYFSAASSLKADAEAAPRATQCVSFATGSDTAEGVLIDQGRWLLKENHLIRKSPPLSLGMYGNVDSTSIDTGQENNSEDSPSHHQTQQNPLAAISSSELEEMAKPQTPKCTYYNMPHGSDSDPFLDDSSVQSGKKDTRSVKGRGFRVSPTIDTSKTWPNKNGSLSSFASVEFKMPDSKVHPEGESSAVAQARMTSSGGRGVLQAQDSLDTLHVRCGQYCPIL